jgi:3-hydroxyisobutyrate dehydrogenase-like beta-hydroxyacid dehydrogenase
MTGSSVVGLLHPGEMGSAVGATLVAGGARVLWASDGRGAETRARAAALGLHDAGTPAALAGRAGVIVSVAPPDAAVAVAREVAAHHFGGVFVDANAIAPATARAIGRLIEDAGARFVDGGIIGPANRVPGAARLYLAGPEAAAVARLFAAGPVCPIVLDGPVGAASALKIAYAGWNKGMQALLMGVRALAVAEGVDPALLAEWRISQPEAAGRSERAVHDNARKAWRFVGEMSEIARAFARVGLPAGFHEAAGEVYRRLAPYKDAPPPTVEEAVGALLRGAVSTGIES